MTDYVNMPTENEETSHINEDFSKGEDHDHIGEQELEAVTGGTYPLMERFLQDARSLVLKPSPPKPDLVLRRTNSAPSVPNIHAYVQERRDAPNQELHQKLYQELLPR